jgi:ATP-binding cassette subfamily F protein 3
MADLYEREEGAAGSALIMVDIDNFTDLNGKYGTQAGNKLLKKLAGLFRKCIKKNDFVARTEADEFALLFSNRAARPKPKPRHDPHRIAEIQTRLVDIDAHSAPARAAAILAGLGFSTADQARPCSEFSGGWRMRVALAATLFAAPDLLLLDEPTNYLDLEGTLWLEDHLANYPRTVIVISHDRDLLDTSVDQILHLDRGKLTLYKRHLRLVRGTARHARNARRQARQAQDRRAQAAAGLRRPLQGQGLQGAPGAVARQDAGADEAGRRAGDAGRAPITFPKPEKMLSPPIIALDDVSVGYDPKSRCSTASRCASTPTTASRCSAPTATASRRWSSCSPAGCAVLGPDHARGKTVGRLFRAASARRAQPRRLALRSRPQADARCAREPRCAPASARSAFPARPATLVKSLSGGEKARLLLGLATFFGPNMIILDEPTNHLDIDSRAALAEAINDFPGAVIMVSHDRYLIEAVGEMAESASGARPQGGP